MGCIAVATSISEIASEHEFEEKQETVYNTKSKHQSTLGIEEISAIPPETAKPKSTSTHRTSLDTQILDYIGMQLPTKHSIHANPRKTSIPSLIIKNKLRGKYSKKPLKPKQPKYRTNEIYKSSPEQSEHEIQDQESSATTTSKKDSKYRSKRFKNYKLSSSDTSTLDMAIEDEDSSSYEFESITKLTAITTLACDNNNSGNETVIENDTVITMSTSVQSQTSTNATSLKVNQTLLKPNVILPLPARSLSRYKGIENPFYHSEDGVNGDDDDIDSNSSYYNNYNWYQPFKHKQQKHFVPHAKGDKVKMGSIYPFLSQSKRSIASTYNSLRAQSSSGETHHTQSGDLDKSRYCNYNPFRPQVVYPPTVSTEVDSTIESDENGSPLPYPHSEYYSVNLDERRYPPPAHTYNHYSPSNRSNTSSTHV